MKPETISFHQILDWLVARPRLDRYGSQMKNTGKEWTTTIDGKQVGGLVFGDLDSSHLLVCLHGWLDNAASFSPLAAELGDDFSLLAIDLPGHGNSYHLEKAAHYHLLDTVYFLEKLRLDLGIEKFYFLSHSLGGILSTLYAGCFPENVGFMISIDSFGPMVSDDDQAAFSIRKHIDSRVRLDSKKKKLHPDFDSAVRARTKDGSLGTKEAKILIARNYTEEQSGLSWKFDQKMRLPSVLRLTELQCKSIMERISCPYLLIRGSQGFEILDKALEIRSAYVENFEVQTCSGGHHVHMEKPQEISEQVKKWITKNS